MSKRSNSPATGAGVPEAPHVRRARRGRPPTTNNPRERILQTAAQLFAVRGYEASSLGELASALNTSKAGIYHYFATKQEIYDSIILNVLTLLNNEVTTAVQAQREPADQLLAFMLAHARTFQAHYHEFVTMLVGFSGMAGVELRHEAIRQRDDYETLLRTIIRGGQESGAFAGNNPATAARAVLSMLNWMARWFKPDGSARAETFARDYYQLVLHGLAASPLQEPAP